MGNELVGGLGVRYWASSGLVGTPVRGWLSEPFRVS